MRRGGAALTAVAAVAAAATLVDRRLVPTVPSAGELGAGVLVAAVVVGLAGLVVSVGVRRAAFVLLPVAVVVAGVEIGLRWWFPDAPAGVQRVLSPAMGGVGVEGGLYRPHHYSLYTLAEREGADDGPAHHPLGLRDHRRLRPDPAAIRVVFIGGSTTYTIGVRDDDRVFTARLERRLNERFAELLAGRRFEVVNAGLPGATSAENLIRLEFLVSEVEPDLVVIHHGLNDGWARAAGDVTPDFSNYRRIWSPPPAMPRGRPLAAGAAEALRRRSMVAALIVGGLRLLPIPAVGDYVRHADERLSMERLASSTTRFFERNTRSMIAVAESFGARVLLATVAVSPEWERVPRRAVAEHNVVLARIAATSDAELFDFARVMAVDPAHMPDGRHVSGRGSDLKADLFFDAFVDLGIARTLVAATSDGERVQFPVRRLP